MARNILQIEEEIQTSIDAESSLSTLTSTSVTAIWKQWKAIIAQAFNKLETLWDVKKKELEDLANAAIPGNAKWYAARVKEWQYGYALSELDGKLYYLVNDDGAKLVARVAAVDGVPLQIKVAKDVSGTLTPLTSLERASLDSYIRDIKFAGTDHQLISIDPDLVRPVAKCYYDGKLDLADFKTSVELALNNYLANIGFNGKLNINKLRDAAEGVFGMIDFQLETLSAKPTGGSYAFITREYLAESGYFIFDPALPLDDAAQLEYISV